MGQHSWVPTSSSEASLEYIPYAEPSPEPYEASSASQRKPGAGIPYRCSCGLVPITQTSTTEKNPGRVFYGCKNSKDGRRHLFKWLDEALMDEIEEIRFHTTKQGECIRQMEDWYNYQEFPTIKALEKEISEMKELLEKNRSEVMCSIKLKDWRTCLILTCMLICYILLKVLLS